MHPISGCSRFTHEAARNDRVDSERSSFILDLALIGRTDSRIELLLKAFPLCLPALLEGVQHWAIFQRALARVVVCQEGAEDWVRPPQREPLRACLLIHADVLEDDGLVQTPSAKHERGLLGDADVLGSVATLATDHRSMLQHSLRCVTSNATVRDQQCNNAA